MLKLANREGKKGITLDLKVTPAAKVDAFAGIRGDRLKVKVAAEAEDGAANAALLKFMAENFRCTSFLRCRFWRAKQGD